MFQAFTGFFLSNKKITLTLMIVIFLFGISSYILLPKQYNPSIVAPAFSIEIPAHSYDAREGHEYIIKTLENKVREIVGVDTMYGYTTDGYVSLMVTFAVGVDSEVAKTRLYDKMYSNYELRPYGIDDIRIRSIDPEDLPQVAYAVVYTGTGLSEKEQGQYLYHIVKNLQEYIKDIPGTTTIDILGGYSSDISIELIPSQVEAFGLDILNVTHILQESFEKGYRGDISYGDKKYAISLKREYDTLDTLKKLTLKTEGNKKVLLQDVANIVEGPVDITKKYRFSDVDGSYEAVFFGVAKLQGTNAVDIVSSVHKKVEEARKILPKNISIITIQDEGETARLATNELITNLFVSIAIVTIILLIFLGLRDAINVAFCIPLVLAIVFIVAYIMDLNINRITLFALILSLGILVDDSIVMVENNARHLSMMARTGRTKMQAILDSVQEVGVSIVLSTITRVISFVAMFAVTGMMGDYMKPIPIFASIALIASTIVAFSINPFLASILHKEKVTPDIKKADTGFLAWYTKKLKQFIQSTPETARKRSWLKRGFWISLLLILVVPVILDVFKARMLPKADKDQVYLWVDMPRDTTIDEMDRVYGDIENFFYASGSPLPAELNLVESLSSSIGDRILPDFANLFRGGENRISEHQMSIRINLSPAKNRDITSEAYVIGVRPLLIAYLTEKYHDITLRLLEDPPGPPTQATFHIKLKGETGTPTTSLVHFSQVVEGVVSSIEDSESLVDLSSSHSTTQSLYHITLDQDKILEQGLTRAQVESTLGLYLGGAPLSIARYEDQRYGPSYINLHISRQSRQDITDIKSLSLYNPYGKKISLDTIATIEPGFKSHDIYTDERSETIHLFAEMGSNSVVYPIIRLYGLLGGDMMTQAGYRKIESSPYKIVFENTNDGKHYTLEWGGEWELTMDTFRDLGVAMIFSLLVIYFIMVMQFGSFQIGGIIMTTFLLSFFGIFPGFALLYMTSGVYFTATAMIGAIALGGIVVGNAIILIDSINQLIKEGKSLEYAVLEGSKKRFIPVMLTSVTAIMGSFTITGDPVWSGLAWSIIWGLSASAVLTLYFIPIFYYGYLIKYHKHDVKKIQESRILEHDKELHTTNP